MNELIRPASMGPRLFSRGRGLPQEPAGGCLHRFNGAAALQPRKACGINRFRTARHCFNGAAALQPRKEGLTAWLTPRLGCFNGAAALQPRKVKRSENDHGARDASMGPRLFSRGRLSWDGDRQVSDVASMGPRLFSRGRRASFAAVILYPLGFNGAAALQPRKGAAPGRLETAPQASMGPRLFSRGRLAGAGRRQCRSLGFNGAAALQPRKGTRSWCCRSRPRASMGPRLFSRGRLKAWNWACDIVVLQWGRGSSAAEGAPPSPRVGIKNDHGFNGAAALQPRKGSISDRTCRPCSRFNGAAALQPRKGAGGIGDVAELPVRLQWGRGSSAAEGSGSAIKSRLNASCFNGAAALQPRKVATGTLPDARLSALQWGRGSSAAEGAGSTRVPGKTNGLQWGRGSSAAEGCLCDAVRPAPREASMGPRLFSRGRTTSGSRPTRRGRLQWGRGSSAAEGDPWNLGAIASRLASMGPRLFSRGRHSQKA